MRAMRGETTTPMLRAPLLADWAVSWSMIKVLTSAGRALPSESIWVAMVPGSANRPYASTSAIREGNRARNPKKATPAPSSGTWSSVVCAHARLRICNQP